MARYIKDFQINTAAQKVHFTINQYLRKEGYEYINYDGENVFKKGKGIISNPTFFKFSYSNNMVRMETWMKYAFFPGVYIGELGLDGFVGCAVKGPWKSKIKNIENILANIAMQTTYSSSTSEQNINNTFDDNETQLLNENDGFEDTCILSENNAAPMGTNMAFCTSCGSQMPEGTNFCSVCGQKRQEVYQTTNEASMPPCGSSVSRKEFINKYAQPSLRKNITSIAILCYVCAGVTFISACLLNPLGIIDALLLAGLALGMHIGKSKVCAILILVLSIIEVLVSLVSGTFPFWWLIAGISAVVTFNKIEKQYKQFLNK